MADRDFLQNHFDHHDREFMKNPYPGYAEMRARCPITWSDRHNGF